MKNGKKDITNFTLFNSIFNPVSTTCTEVFQNNGYQTIILEITGDFSNLSLKIKGAVFMDQDLADMVVLECLDLGTKLPVQEIENKGIYKISVAGLQKIGFFLNEIEGGSVTIVGNLITNTKENGRNKENDIIAEAKAYDGQVDIGRSDYMILPI